MSMRNWTFAPDIAIWCAQAKKRKTMTERSQIATSFLPLPGSAPVEWRIEPRPHVVGAGTDRLAACSKSFPAKQVRDAQ